jgi:hypothetical protein
MRVRGGKIWDGKKYYYSPQDWYQKPKTISDGF